MPPYSFQGLRVLTLESRRAPEMTLLIANYGGHPFAAPALREVPLESTARAIAFADALDNGEFDIVLLLTGVGARALVSVVEETRSRESFVAALGRTKLAVRGPKPLAALRELGLSAWVTTPEPNTWRELLAALDAKTGDHGLHGRRVAVQEYGISNDELVRALESRGAQVTLVPVYRWSLPENIEPLRAAVSHIVHGELDIVLFTTGVQVTHLMQIAAGMALEDAVRDALERIVVASIGPATTEALARHRLTPDLEPSHPKMGFLVKETAERCHELLRAKRRSRIGPPEDALPMQVLGPRIGGAPEIDFLHEISSRFAAADSLHIVLGRIVHFVSSVVQCDSCFIYVLENQELVLRASKTPHVDVIDSLKLRVGQGITGWVAEHRQPVAVGCHAFDDPRFQIFNELPEDRYEAFLSVPVLCRGRLVAVINVQHRSPHDHTRQEIQMISMVGFLVGAEIEMARLEVENNELSERLETRKVLDRAKGILQRDLRINEEEAYLTIQRQSRQRRKTKREIAEAIVLGDDLRRGKDA